MKTQKTGGRYDFTRRAFASIEDMAAFLDRSPSYCQSRLTGGEDFTEKELDALNHAVIFYDLTSIYPVKFQEMQKNTEETGMRLVYSLAWNLISYGANMVYAIKAAQNIAGALYNGIPDAGAIIDSIYKLTED